ncbi:MAG: DUF6266 family protein [Pedobacter sp.]
MGILTRGILGPMLNTTGAVIGKISRGQNIITALREDTPKAASDEQAEQRYKFKLLRDFFLTFPELVKAGFKKKKQHQGPFEAAFQYNYNHAFSIAQRGEGAAVLDLTDRIKLNFPALKYSVGPVYGPNCGTVVRNNDNTCTFSWLAYPQSVNGQFTDRAGYVIWNALTGNASYGTDIASRGALTFNVPLSPVDVNAELHFYMHFNSLDKKTVGDTIYLGSTL